MKIYNKIVFDNDMNIIVEDSFEYNGNIADCKGGGGSTTTNTQDPVYNARMAAIAESQQEMAEDYFKFWETGGGKDLESAMTAANLEMLPKQTAANISDLDLSTAQSRAALGLVDDETDYRKAELGYGTERMASELRLLPQVETAKRSLLNKSIVGTDIDAAANRASADVAREFGKSKSTIMRDAAGLGRTTSNRDLAGLNFERSKAVSAARTTGREDARARNVAELSTALNTVR